MTAAASFSNQIGDGGKDLATLLAAILTWSGSWFIFSLTYVKFDRKFNYSIIIASLTKLLISAKLKELEF